MQDTLIVPGSVLVPQGTKAEVCHTGQYRG